MKFSVCITELLISQTVKRIYTTFLKKSWLADKRVRLFLISGQRKRKKQNPIRWEITNKTHTMLLIIYFLHPDFRSSTLILTCLFLKKKKKKTKEAWILTFLSMTKKDMVFPPWYSSFPQTLWQHEWLFARSWQSLRGWRLEEFRTQLQTLDPHRLMWKQIPKNCMVVPRG